MKKIALVAALAALLSTTTIGAAAACGGAGARRPGIGTATFPPQTAVGVWPSLKRDRDRTLLTFSYPRIDDQGTQRYMDSFEVVRDRNLRGLERTLAGRDFPNLGVTIERVDATRWRVTGWSVRA